MTARRIYAQPFRFNVSPADIDAGADFCGFGPVHAIGPGKILQRGVPSHTSTFGSSMSSMVITQGPLKGLPIYFVEHYNLVGNFGPGDEVDAGTKLYEQNGCIEIGIATADGRGSLAWSSQGYREGETSRLGVNIADLLSVLGCPRGPKRGTLVGSLPSWIPARSRAGYKRLLDGWIKG
jgi:hypothetical protein